MGNWHAKKSLDGQMKGTITGAGIAQFVSAQPSELEVPGSILGDSNVCFDFLLICVALALNTYKMEHWQRKGG